MIAIRPMLKRAVPFAIAIGIWFAPVPAGLTPQAWHLFAVFVAAIASVLLGSFPLLTAAMLAVGTVVLTKTITPAQAFSGFANSSVLLVVVAFIVAQAVVKSGLGRRISLLMVSRFGGSSLGLAYSIVLTDAAIAPRVPQQHRSPAACSFRSCWPFPRERAPSPTIPRGAGSAVTSCSAPWRAWLFLPRCG